MDIGTQGSKVGRRAPRRGRMALAGALAAGMLAGILPGVGAPVLVAQPAGAVASAAPQGALPLLTWDLLRQTVYNPMGSMTWPDSLRMLDGKQVHLEGYVLPNFGAQDPADVLFSPRTTRAASTADRPT